MSFEDVALLALLGAAWIALSQFFRRRPLIRKKVTSSRPWKFQFSLHPVIIGGLVYHSCRSRNPLWMIVLSPFVFNFGIEPWDQPQSLVFNACFYGHHVAPLLACLDFAGEGLSVEAGKLERFAIAQGLVFAHVWLLHTVGSLEWSGFAIKQRIFWPYVIQGFVLNAFWFHSCLLLGSSPSLFALPLLLQYCGRWGLYLSVCVAVGWPKPGDKGYDSFEVRKMPAEFISLCFAAAACVAFW